LFPEARGTSSVRPAGEPVAVKVSVLDANDGMDTVVAARALRGSGGKCL